jgi:REP element-mobilizing transposase RayT
MRRDEHAKFDPQKHHRQSIRLQGYDYSQAGLYYVTIVAYQRECLFGEVVDGEMKLNRYGEIVQWEWLELPKRIRYIELGGFVVMPNHVHGFLVFRDPVLGATRPDLTVTHSGKAGLHNKVPDDIGGSPLPPRGPKPASLGAIVAQFKSRVTKRIWKTPEMNGTPVWQRNYYEHIIRNEREMENIWRYIESNPAMWNDDDENPSLLDGGKGRLYKV